MSTNITLNSSNIANKNHGNNKLTYTFPSVQEFSEGDIVTVSQMSLYFSWFNISAKYNNNKLNYTWWDLEGKLTKTNTITFPDGFYSIQTMYEYIQKVMVRNGHYLIVKDSTSPNDGQFMYLFELRSNSTFYSIEIVLSSISTSFDLGSGLKTSSTILTIPSGDAGDWGLPATFQTISIDFPNNNFGDLLGFRAGTSVFEDLSALDPLTATNAKYNYFNELPPQMMPSSSYLLSCNLIDNSMAIPSNILHSFGIPPGVGFGDQILASSGFDIYSPIKPGKYSNIQLSILDQNFDPLEILDSSMLITLSIKKHKATPPI